MVATALFLSGFFVVGWLAAIRHGQPELRELECVPVAK